MSNNIEFGEDIWVKLSAMVLIKFNEKIKTKWVHMALRFMSTFIFSITLFFLKKRVALEHQISLKL